VGPERWDEGPSRGLWEQGTMGRVPATHTGALDRHPDRWEARVTAFLAAALDVEGP
jgi:hypothetical protein